MSTSTADRDRKGWRRSGWVLAVCMSVGCQAPGAPAPVAADESADASHEPVVVVDESPSTAGERVQVDDEFAVSPVAPFDYFDGLRCRLSVPTPEAGLGHGIGQHFTRQPDMLSYLESIAESSDRVEMRQYGWTNQRRPLVYLVISAPKNLQRLPEILERNDALSDPSTDDATVQEIIETNPAIAWFSYNVHGNEPSCTEAAIALVYTLASAMNPEVDAMLNDVVLVVDPLLNPDGRERYVSWYQNALGAAPLEHPNAAEHYEPWPGGRSNHYMFDLNRDWSWLTQVESQQRLPVYRRFRPQLHIDHHEQGYQSPFFFGAGDTPYNANIPATSKRWIEEYGQANAKAFDANGLVYSTRERFDYLYPGYGKVLPVYYGAIGMLAEKGGHSRAGLSIRVNGNYTLTLRDRASHHWLLGMSNLEYTATSRKAQLERFRSYYVESAAGGFTDTSAFVVAPGNDPYKLQRLFTLCQHHGIVIETVDHDTSVDGLHPFETGDAEEAAIVERGSWVIRTGQPMGRLANALFERSPFVEDRDTYDITAWSGLIAMGLDASYIVGDASVSTTVLSTFEPAAARLTGESDGVAVIIDAAQDRFPRAIGLASSFELFGRIASAEFSVDGRTFSRGSLILHTVRNDPDVLSAFMSAVMAEGVSGHRASSGVTESGPVLGANANRVMKSPRVLLLKDDMISSLSYGQHWHLFDVVSPLPYTPVTSRGLREIDLKQFNVLVVPSGRNLNIVLGQSEDRIRQWVRDGGVIVAIGGSVSWANNTILEVKDARETEHENGTDDVEADPEMFRLSYEERDSKSVDERIPGAMLQVSLDMTHPLTAGMQSWLGIIKQGSRMLPVGESGFVIGTFTESPYIGGAISAANLEKLGSSPFMTQHRMGRGSVICLVEDPTMRGFQYGPMRLLLNAIVYGPSL